MSSNDEELEHETNNHANIVARQLALADQEGEENDDDQDDDDLRTDGGREQLDREVGSIRR